MPIVNAFGVDAVIVAVPPSEIDVPLIVKLEFVNEAFPMSASELDNPLIVLLVSVCVSDSVTTVASILIDPVETIGFADPVSPVPSVI